MNWTPWRRRDTTLADNDIRELTAQFYVTLEASFAKVKCRGEPRCGHAYTRVEQMLAPDGRRNWTNAYAIEQLLVHLLDEETIATELQIRVREARAALRPPLAEYYGTEASKASLTTEAQRALLARLVNDLQWRYTVNEVKREYSKNITMNTGRLFIASLIVFAAALLLTLRWPQLQKTDLRLLVPAILSGCWGAAFSMLSSLKSRLDASELDDLKILRALSVLGSRLLVGAGAASILYFFFVSGLVSGNAFPALLDVKPEDWLKNLALLVVWCFIAGFSERLIPGLLARTEARLDMRPERFRPSGGQNGSQPPPPAADVRGAARPEPQLPPGKAGGDKKPDG